MQVGMGMVALLLLVLLAFAMLTALALGSVTVLLVLALTAFSLLLVGEDGVVALALDCRKLIGLLALVLPFVALAAIAAHRFRLKLSKNSIAHINEFDTFEAALLGDNRDKHLPFLRECGEKYHHFDLFWDIYFCRCKALEGSTHFVHSRGRILVGIKADGQSFLKIFIDRGRCSLTITIFKTIPDGGGGVKSGDLLLNRGREVKGHMTNCHIIHLIPIIKSSLIYFKHVLRRLLRVKDIGVLNHTIYVLPKALCPKEGTHNFGPSSIV